MTHTRTITLPDHYDFKGTKWPVKDLPDSLFTDLVFGGIGIIANNTYNSAKEKDKTIDKVVALAKWQKRWDSWLKGDYSITERAASSVQRMREAYVAEQMAAGNTTSGIDKVIRDTVTRVLGEKEAARFDTFLKCHATELATATGMEAGVIEAALVAKYEAAADAREAEKAANPAPAMDKAAALAALEALGIAPKA